MDLEKIIETHKEQIQESLNTGYSPYFNVMDIVSIENKLANVHSGHLIVVKEKNKEIQYYTGGSPFLTNELAKAAIYDKCKDLTGLVEFLNNLPEVIFVKFIEINSKNIIRNICSEHLNNIYNNFLVKYIPNKELDENKTYCVILAYNTKTNEISSCSQLTTDLFPKKIGTVDNIKYMKVSLELKNEDLLKKFYLKAENFPYRVFQLFTLSKEQVVEFNNRYNKSYSYLIDTVNKINNTQNENNILDSEYNKFLLNYKPKKTLLETTQVLCLQYNNETKEIGICKYSYKTNMFTDVVVIGSADWFFNEKQYNLYKLSVDIVEAYKSLIIQNPNITYKMFTLTTKNIENINKRTKTKQQIAYDILDREYNSFLLNYIPKQKMKETTYVLCLQYNNETKEIGICQYSTKNNIFSRVIVIGSADWYFNNKTYNLYPISEDIVEAYNSLVIQNTNITYKMYNLTSAQINKFNKRREKTNYGKN